jgi:protein SCO1
MNYKLAAVALSALITGGSMAYLLVGAPAPRTYRQGESVNTGKAIIGGPFSLVDQSGKAVTDKDFRGRYLLVFFGYTYCPDVCPSGLQVISSALDLLGTDADKITPVFISIDPARDTPEKMAAYVKSFHPRMIGLTGSAADVAAAIKAYRVYAKKVPDDRNPADYTMDHSSVVYLMGPTGELVTFAAEITKPDTLAQQLRKGLGIKG